MSVTFCFSSFLLYHCVCFFTGQFVMVPFNMLGMYLDTLIIGHTFVSVLSIINALTLQNKIAKWHNK